MIALKRSYIVLLIGVGTLVAGSIVLGVNSSVLATDFLTNNLIIKKATISPGEEYKTEMSIATGGTVSVLLRGQPFENQFTVNILEGGNPVWTNTFNGDHISNFESKPNQAYKIVIKNIGRSDATVDAIIGDVPFLGLNDKANLDNVSGALAGLVVGIIGFIVLIIGAVLFFVERKSKKIASPTTS